MHGVLVDGNYDMGVFFLIFFFLALIWGCMACCFLLFSGTELSNQFSFSLQCLSCTL